MAPTSEKRIYQIDLFRFIAALCIVLFHYLFKVSVSDNFPHTDFNKLGDFFKFGYLGVDLFFIISGFVITLSIKNKSFQEFAISRFIRLYPTYWIAVFLTFNVIQLCGAPLFFTDFKEFFANLTMFQNYIGADSLDGVYWTLFIEMKFYVFVIAPFLILRNKLNLSLDYLLYIWLLLTCIYPYGSELYIFKVANYFFILDWSSYFISGIIFYQIYSKEPSPKYIFLLIYSLLIAIYHATNKVPGFELEFNTSFSPYIIGCLILLFYFLMLLVSLGRLKSINSPKLCKLGMLTYPLYLIHQNIGYIIFNKLGAYINKYALLGGTIILMILIAYIISDKYDRKATRTLNSSFKNLLKTKS